MSVIQFYLIIFIATFVSNTAVLKQDDPLSCLDCHNALIEKNVMHPVAESCDNCHVANGKEHPQPGVAGFTLAEALPEMCFLCHDVVQADIQKSKVVHKVIFGKKSCLDCHSPHSSAQEKLLVVEEKQLCLGCHNRIYANDSSYTSNIKQLLDKSKYVHGAIDGGGCLACHSPHAAENQSLLKDVFPNGFYAEGKPENYALCFSCHDSQMMAADTSTSATQFRNGNKNLHYLHLNGGKGRTCVLCHNVHASGQPHLIIDAIEFGKWEMPMRYKSLENGGSCYPGCHSEKTYSYAN